MPLPRDSEAAAAQIARLIDRFDDDLDEWIAGGGRRPSVNRLLEQVLPLIEQSVTAAVLQVDPDATPDDIAPLVTGQYEAIQAVIRASLRDAEQLRRQAPRRPPRRDDNETIAGFVARVGAVAALTALAARAGRKPRDVARSVGVRLPRRRAAHVRTLVRTETAIGRNRHAADVAVRDRKVIRVLDARKGPTDQECEDVNGRYATAQWIRSHPVEHPNCTRLGRPVRLPAGAFVTLLE